MYPGNFLVHGFVVHDEDALTRIASANLGFGIDGAFRQRGWRRAALPQLGGEPESAAHADRALGARLPAHQFSQTSGDGQAKAGAPVPAGHRVVGLLEGAEEPA